LGSGVFSTDGLDYRSPRCYCRFQCPFGLWGLFYQRKVEGSAKIREASFSARLGSGVFSTESALESELEVGQGFSARLGSGVFSTRHERLLRCS